MVEKSFIEATAARQNSGNPSPDRLRLSGDDKQCRMSRHAFA